MEAGRGIDSANASGLCPNVAGDVAQTALPFVEPRFKSLTGVGLLHCLMMCADEG